MNLSVLSLVLVIIHICLSKTLIDPDVNGIISAFGYFNSDRLADVFLITDNGKSLEIAQGMASEPFLKKLNPPIKCSLPNNTNDYIVAVIPSDFGSPEHHGIALMDILVVTADTTVKERNKMEFKFWILKNDITHPTQLRCNFVTPFKDKAKSQPLVFDYDGDMIADILIDGESKECKKLLWTIVADPHQNGSFSCPKELQTDDDVNIRSKYPHSNAFVDLGFPKPDMSPDLFIAGDTNYEYWSNHEGFSRINMSRFSYPQNYGFIGQSSFVDINMDSRIDHIIPVCKTSIEACDDPEILAFNITNKTWYSIANLKNSNYTFAVSNYDYIDFPVTLRYGDIDADGYNDLITIMRVKGSKDNTKAVILRNERENNAFGRKFVIHDQWTKDINDESADRVILAVFFDLSEDGKYDVLLNVIDKQTKLLKISAFINKQMIDACFFKVMVSSGVCPDRLPNISNGTNQRGPQICYELPDNNNQKGCTGQLSQSAHFALQLPYTIFGLGEMPNFIDTITASIPSGKNKLRKHEWTQIVPDSQIVLIPCPIDDPSDWTSKLFITPSKIVYQTLITLASICCLLVLIIGILHRKELLEDLAEHEEYKRHWPESR